PPSGAFDSGLNCQTPEPGRWFSRREPQRKTGTGARLNRVLRASARRLFPRSRTKLGFLAGLLTHAIRKKRLPIPAGRNSGLLLLPTQLQWRGRAGVSPDFPIARTAPGTEANLALASCAVKCHPATLDGNHHRAIRENIGV